MIACTPDPLVTIGWYADGRLLDSHTLRASKALDAIANKRGYNEVRYVTKARPGLRSSLAAQDAALAVESETAAGLPADNITPIGINSPAA